MTMSTTPPTPWASLVCPHRSTNHAVIRPQQTPPGITLPGGVESMNVQIIPADVPCIGHRCAIFHTCRPGEKPLAAPPTLVGGSE